MGLSVLPGTIGTIRMTSTLFTTWTSSRLLLLELLLVLILKVLLGNLPLLEWNFLLHMLKHHSNILLIFLMQCINTLLHDLYVLFHIKYSTFVLHGLLLDRQGPLWLLSKLANYRVSCCFGARLEFIWLFYRWDALDLFSILTLNSFILLRFFNGIVQRWLDFIFIRIQSRLAFVSITILCRLTLVSTSLWTVLLDFFL